MSWLPLVRRRSTSYSGCCRRFSGPWLRLLARSAFKRRKTSCSRSFLSETTWSPGQQTELCLQVTGFGTNPNNVGMYVYRPTRIATNPALIVAIHYCTGTYGPLGERLADVDFRFSTGILHRHAICESCRHERIYCHLSRLASLYVDVPVNEPTLTPHRTAGKCFDVA